MSLKGHSLIDKHYLIINFPIKHPNTSVFICFGKQTFAHVFEVMLKDKETVIWLTESKTYEIFMRCWRVGFDLRLPSETLCSPARKVLCHDGGKSLYSSLGWHFTAGE